MAWNHNYENELKDLKNILTQKPVFNRYNSAIHNILRKKQWYETQKRLEGLSH